MSASKDAAVRMSNALINSNVSLAFDILKNQNPDLTYRYKDHSPLHILVTRAMAIGIKDMAPFIGLICEKDPQIINAKDSTGNTAMHYIGAMYPMGPTSGNQIADIAPLFLCLLGAGADLNILNDRARTFLDYAIEKYPGIMNDYIRDKEVTKDSNGNKVTNIISSKYTTRDILSNFGAKTALEIGISDKIVRNATLVSENKTLQSAQKAPPIKELGMKRSADVMDLHSQLPQVQAHSSLIQRALPHSNSIGFSALKIAETPGNKIHRSNTMYGIKSLQRTQAMRPATAPQVHSASNLESFKKPHGRIPASITRS